MKTEWKRPGFRGLIGVSRWDITPPTPIYARNWGAAEHDFAEGVHLPLTGTALAFAEGGDSAPRVLMSLDLGFFRSKAEEARLRQALLQGSQLEESALIVHLTHTHAGPGTEYDLESRYEPEVVIRYLESLEIACIQGIDTAIRDLRSSVLVTGWGNCSLATNRDFPHPADPETWLCGFNPGAEADSTLLVGQVLDPEGRTRATLVNYACHPTTLAWQNKKISPDFPGPMRELVEAQTGAPCLFYNGACGELSPAEQYTADLTVVERNGRQLGYAVLSVLEGMAKSPGGLVYRGAIDSGAPLADWVPAPLEPGEGVNSEILEISLTLKPGIPKVPVLEQELAAATKPFARERLRRKLKWVREFSGLSTSWEQAWAWRLGNCVLLAHPFEAYSQLQVALREASGFANPVFVGNRTNGWGGYLPPESEYGKDLYQVWETPFERGSLEQLIEHYRGWLRD